jgi:MFS family permease
MAIPAQPHTDLTPRGEAHAHRLAGTLRTPGFPVLWGATLCGQVGAGMQQVLLGWLVLSMTDSSSMVGVLFAVRSLPNVLVGFAAGAITDRLDRRMLMRVMVGGMALVSWLIAWLVCMEQMALWPLLLCACLFGLLQAFEFTARQVYTCDVVGLSAAVQGLALLSIAQRLGGVLGSLLAGAALQWWGSSVSFLLMGISYGGGAVALWTLRHRGAAAPRVKESMWHNVVAYGQELRTNRLMQSLMLSTAGAELLGFSHQVLLPILAKDVLHSGATGLGILTAARSLGGVVGSSILTALSPMRHRGVLLLAILVFFGAGQVVLAHAPDFWLAVGCVMFINTMAAAADLLHMVLLQHSVANEHRGRAMGAWVVGSGTAPLGHLEIGYLAGVAGAHLALLLNGVGLMALDSAFVLCLPRLRRL